MRGFMRLIGLVFLLSLGSAPAWAVKLGETCDGIAALRCYQGLWCEHPAGQCKFADGAGACAQEEGLACDALACPVCGCDGLTYSNDCERRSKHVQLDHTGECTK
jgi:hypothetical protein